MSLLPMNCATHAWPWPSSSEAGISQTVSRIKSGPFPEFPIAPSRAHGSSYVAQLRLVFSARSRAVEQEFAFACVERHRRRALKLLLSLGEAMEFEQKIAAYAGQEVIGLERRLRCKPVDDLQPRRRTESHRDRDRAIQLHDRRRREPGKSVIERGNALPIRLRACTRPSVTCRDSGLQRIRAEYASELFCALKRSETATNEKLIPAPTVLIQEQNGRAGRADPRA